VDLSFDEGGFGVVGLHAYELIHDFMRGDPFCIIQLLENQLADFFQSGLVDAYDLTQYLHLAL
jgi:hypothetical protein